MGTGNETVSRHCRFLNTDFFPQLYSAFTEAFSDYVFPFALTETQFRNHILLNAVDLDATVGCIIDGKIAGFSLNGFGDWEGRSTVYVAGTGVIPSERRQGISDEMFEMMMPIFKARGIGQCLLEVITTNQNAMALYNKFGFHSLRELALMQCDVTVKAAETAPAGVEIRKNIELDWERVTTFWDGKPSWQNSIDAVNRTLRMKKIAGAFIDDKCVGYIVYSSNFGRVAQIAVAPEHRNRGIGRSLILRLQDDTAAGYSLQIINVDKSLSSVMSFFTNLGFYERVSQYEMIKPM